MIQSLADRAPDPHCMFRPCFSDWSASSPPSRPPESESITPGSSAACGRDQRPAPGAETILPAFPAMNSFPLMFQAASSCVTRSSGHSQECPWPVGTQSCRWDLLASGFGRSELPDPRRPFNDSVLGRPRPGTAIRPVIVDWVACWISLQQVLLCALVRLHLNIQTAASADLDAAFAATCRVFNHRRVGASDVDVFRDRHSILPRCASE